MTSADLTPFLDGDRIVGGFYAGAGPSWAVGMAGMNINEFHLALLLPVILLLRVRRYRVVLTDRSIIALRLSPILGKPRQVDARVPRRTQLGPFGGRGWIRIGGIRMFAAEVSDKQSVQNADEAMGFPRPEPGIW